VKEIDSPNMGFVGFRLLKKVKDSPLCQLSDEIQAPEEGMLDPVEGAQKPTGRGATPAGETTPIPVGAEGRDAKYLVMSPTSTLSQASSM